MNILAWILFGMVAGIVANLIDPAPSSGGVVGSIVLGILGSFVGGFLANMVFGLNVTGFNFQSLAIAVLGSLLLLVVGRSFRGRSLAN